jgi:hypothetical protein
MKLHEDIVKGGIAIGQVIGEPKWKVYRLHHKGLIPTFRIGNEICARISELDRRYSSQSNAE